MVRGLVLAAACCFSLTAAPPALTQSPTALVNPPHGRWVVRHPGSPPVLECDVTYYPVTSRCLQPIAFAANQEPTDALPASIAAFTAKAEVSRLVELAHGDGRLWRIYLAVENKTEDSTGDPCLEVSDGGAYRGGTCVVGSSLVGSAPTVDWLMNAGVVLGIASNSTARVSIVDTDGHDHAVPITPGRSFVYFCAGSCACDVSEIVGTRAGRPTELDNLRSRRPHTPWWCRR
jgi:hypothetical protein